MKKNYLIIIILTLFLLGACSQSMSDASSVTSYEETEISTESSFEEEEIKEDAYIPGKVQFYDSEQKTMVDWVKPDNIDQYVGTYEGVRDEETITLTITEEGYFTAFWIDHGDGKYRESKHNEPKDSFYYLSGVVTTEFNDVKLNEVASLYYYGYHPNASIIFDEDGNFKNMDIYGEVTILNEYSASNSHNKVGSIWLGSIPLTDIDESILIFENFEQFNLIDNDHARIKFKSEGDFDLTRIDAPSKWTKQSVFQYIYPRLREMKTEKIDGKYHFYQLLGLETAFESRYDLEDDKYLDYTGYDKSGSQLKMQFIVATSGDISYGPMFFGYDGEKVYKGEVDTDLKTINWEEYELPRQKVLKYFEN